MKKKTSKRSNQGRIDELPKAKKVRKKRAVKVKKVSVKAPAKKASGMMPTSTTENSNCVHVSFPIVGIGASAGGLEAFEAFFAAMPADSGMAFVLVAHLSPTHASLLPELLQKKAAIPVCQVRDNMVVKPNHVYIIPPNKDLRILNGVLHLMELSRPRGVNLPIDSFFRSLAQDQGSNAICIILSGTGTDGSLGVKAIKGEVGMVMVQDEISAKYDGMPHSAIATDLADYVLQPEQMPKQLIDYVRYAQHKTITLTPEVDKLPETLNSALQKIYLILRTHTDHDFSEYKNNTICRRIERRMDLHQIADINDYVCYLQESDSEVDILYKELLIGVTNFFRDPEAFNQLKNVVLPEIIKGKPEGYTFRIWVPGCSTGEEAYSLAIILHEYLQHHHRRYFKVQIFGTDIDTDAIDIARSGLYPASIKTDVSPERLNSFFVMEEDGRYKIRKMIREMLVFASQNLIKDPPFTKLDLISCRNLFIYFGSELQNRLFPLFHYSLKSDGWLFLGSSESIGQSSELFSLLNKKWKMFRRKSSSFTGHPALEFPPVRTLLRDQKLPEKDTHKQTETLSSIKLIEAILDESDAPTCVIIDDAYDVVYIHGHTGQYLEPPMGKVSVNILEMARPGLKAELAAAIHKVRFRKHEEVLKNLSLKQNGGFLRIDLTVKPVLENSGVLGLMMVVFDDPRSSTTEAPLQSEGKQQPQKKRNNRSMDEMEQELRYTRENLQITIEELETSNEELKSTNEELQSTNEELQSTNEELETSREELQSLNEESVTVNAELQSRINELSNTNDDMKNLLDSTDLATLFLDTNLCIRRFTPKATSIIPLASTDAGRPIKHFATSLLDIDISILALQVLDDLGTRKVEARNQEGAFYVIQARPYRTVNNVIDGVVITFEDISERKKLEDAYKAAQEFAENIVDTVREPLVVLDHVLRVVKANRSFYRVFHVNPKETNNQLIYELGNGQWAVPQLRKLLEDLLPEKKIIEAFEITHNFHSIGQRTMMLNARQIVGKGVGEGQVFILLAIEDVTAREVAKDLVTE